MMPVVCAYWPVRKLLRLGAQMILNDRALPVGQADRRALAFATLYHRDGVPDLGDELLLSDRDDRAALRKVLALLRAVFHL